MPDKQEIIKGARNAVSIAAAAAVVTTNPHLIAAAAIGTLAGDAIGYAERHFERKQARLKARAEALAQEVLERLADVEEKLEIPEERVDLATEVFRKALEDDEDQKELYYGAILELILKDDIDVQTIKVLTSGVQMLAKIELDEFVFAVEAHGDGSSFWLRLAMLDLKSAPMKRESGYGELLQKRLESADFVRSYLWQPSTEHAKKGELPEMWDEITTFGDVFLAAVLRID